MAVCGSEGHIWAEVEMRAGVQYGMAGLEGKTSDVL